MESATSCNKKWMEFVNRDFNAAINIRRRAVMERRLAYLTRENFMGNFTRWNYMRRS